MSEPADCIKHWLRATAPVKPLADIDALRRTMACYESQVRRNDVSDNMCEVMMERLDTIKSQVEFWQKSRPSQKETVEILRDYA